MVPPAAVLVGSVASLTWRYWDLRPVARRIASEREVEAVARLARRCGHCGALILFGGAACPECGELRHPRTAAALVALLAVGLVVSLVLLWMKSGS